MSEETKATPTVEEALRELREMFPIQSLFVSETARWYSGDPGFSHSVYIEIGPTTSFASSSFADCMAQIRAWKESNNQ